MLLETNVLIDAGTGAIDLSIEALSHRRCISHAQSSESSAPGSS
jgi:hypothetical protein